ncbi:alpha/beta hydrolase [Ramlibacter rhizophilus]|uniref:Alpha/beta hydrolase n=1 Tax=Ramlibacter rhizophilus TaxID=1781167 RepID=A0A4Z0BF31_9BURK|nr:alpha/beta hydrolase [Ramlibacter rhizophilus]
MPRSDSTLSTFTAGDGENIAVQHWRLPAGAVRRGAVLLVHGLGEHAGRHERLAQRLVAWGFEVHGYDQCGHGESSGRRGRIPSIRRLLQDLQDLIEATRRRLAPGEPLIVLGHSMGALVVTRLLLLRDMPVDGVVLSSPAFMLRLGPVQRFMLRIVPRLAPDLAVGNGIAPEALSHDPDVVDAYRSDPLVHDRVSGRLARFMAEAGTRVLAQAGRWKLPTLLVWGGSDCVVDPRGSRRFAERTPPGVVRACAFRGLFHEVFNEMEAEPVYAALQRWLEETFPPPPRGAAPASPVPQRMPPPAAPIPS